MNARELIHQLTPLYGAGEAQAIVRMVMETRFDISLADLLLGKDSELSPNDRTEFEKLAAQLLKGIPVQQVLGFVDFCGHRFRVTPDVLIPRPETEELVAWVRETLDNTKYSNSMYCLFDIGTGSGCIAISLALALRNVEVTALDIDAQALAVARMNADALHAPVHFLQGDILEGDLPNQTPDIIVSNPPYIRQSEAQDMSQTVLDHEPHLALFVPDDDPLRFYKAIADFALLHANKPCLLFFEINSALGKETVAMLQNKHFNNIILRKDQFGNERFIKAEIS